MLEFEALLKTTKSEALMFFLKAVGSGKEPTRGEGPTFLVISSTEKGLLG